MPTVQPAHTLTVEAVWIDRLDRVRTMLVDRAAAEAARRGYRRIALVGSGDNVRRYIRQPWAWHGVTVAAVVDPATTRTQAIEGVPIVEPNRLADLADAAVVCSDTNEPAAAAECTRLVGASLPILRPFAPVAPDHEPGEAGERTVAERLAAEGRSPDDAAWIAANRTERHDASIRSLPPVRTEMHLRRYELAATYTPGARVLDAACGTGYGAARLGSTAADVLGVDIDPRTIAYARRYHSRDNVRFAEADAARIDARDGSFDLITSFETIEHAPDPATLITEFARLLKPSGVLVLSTPNDAGLTDFHEHSLTRSDLDRLLEPSFTTIRSLGQRPGNEPVEPNLPPGIFTSTAFDPETLLVIAERA